MSASEILSSVANALKAAMEGIQSLAAAVQEQRYSSRRYSHVGSRYQQSHFAVHSSRQNSSIQVPLADTLPRQLRTQRLPEMLPSIHQNLPPHRSYQRSYSREITVQFQTQSQAGTQVHRGNPRRLRSLPRRTFFRDRRD